MKRIISAAAILALSQAVQAFNKCEIDGKTVYQQSPCPGEVVLPQEPTPEQRQKAEEFRERLRDLARDQRRQTQSRQATVLPELGVEAWCRAVASASGGFSQSIFNGCIRREQAAYDDLKASYGQVSREVRQWCEQVATASTGGSYSTLHGCIEREARAASGASTFKR